LLIGDIIALLGLQNRSAAVDDGQAGDVAGAGGGEEDGDALDLAFAANAAEGDLLLGGWPGP